MAMGFSAWLQGKAGAGGSDALAETINKALSLSASERATLAAKGIANIHDHFSKDMMCAKTLDVYNEVLALPKAP